jgi:DhnA family fructose-bisphosphate aldolase class Ia
MTDSLKAFETLTAANLPEPAARAIVQAIDLANGIDMATLKVEMHIMEESLTQEIADLFKADMTKMENRLSAQIGAQIIAQAAKTKADIMQWMFTLFVAQFFSTAGIMLTLIKLLK